MTTTWNWRKASRSTGNGACVEVGTGSDTSLIAVRDSKSGDAGPVLTFTRRGITAFLAKAKTGSTTT
ncbi:DUF397 domain-containing protein [Actinosynnema sp. CS-041913]|uniref:DUF397 domain-containing protein n=1 Tax=Actinosynnema sp. CS-041913 TaxID=3239917 RepID=UPI003D8DAF3E